MKEATRAYWRWARWSLLWTFSNVVIGISLVLMAFNRLVTLKFSDFHLEQNGGVAWLNPKSFFGFYRGLALAYLLPTASLFLVIGCGVRSAARSVRDPVDGKPPYRVDGKVAPE